MGKVPIALANITIAKELIFTVRNSSCGKIMFSQACINSSVHKGWGGVAEAHV